jgi:hypothetical protein
MLQRAVEILGGTDELAAYLGVSPARLRIWMRGIFAPPDDIFLRLVDLISDPPPRKAGGPHHRETPG